MKRKLGVLLAVVFMLVVSTAEAKGLDVVVRPCYEHVNDIEAKLVISNEGMASITARCVSSTSNIKKINLHVYLQKYVNEEWTNVQYWPATSETRTCTLSKSVEVTHGYSYRVKVSAYVMTENDSEQIVIYSGSKWY